MVGNTLSRSCKYKAVHLETLIYMVRGYEILDTVLGADWNLLLLVLKSRNPRKMHVIN